MSERKREQDKWHERGFAAGTCVAAAIIVSAWGCEVEAEEILGAAGLTTRSKCKRLGVDAYDLDQLKSVFATLKSRQRRKP